MRGEGVGACLITTTKGAGSFAIIQAGGAIRLLPNEPPLFCQARVEGIGLLAPLPLP